MTQQIYRRPTYDEISERVRHLGWCIGVISYLFIGFGGYFLFTGLINDQGWVEVFTNIWWLPSGAAAYWSSMQFSQWIIAFVPEKKNIK
ncbi:MAG: hypothetical protein J0653_06340 [Deltaproteobacteria bacterium]|nr:hypothetical protein [Deltaproteobacteria bacterium]